MALTDDQLKFFKEKGYLVLEGFASKEECEGLRAEMGSLLSAVDLSTESSSIFSTRNQTKLSDDYFLQSGRKISFFFEEKAFDGAGNLKQAKDLSINKVGHALHDLNPTFRQFSRSPRMAEILRSLNFKQPVLIQSMYIFKQPGIGGEVVPHQDSSFLFTDPPSCHGFWVALQDATPENGCLWVLPSSHKEPISRRFIVKDGAVTFDGPAEAYDLSLFTPLPASTGTLVILHGATVHYSCENTSSVSRHAYTVHVVEGSENSTYPANNWLQCYSIEDPPFEPVYGANQEVSV